MSLDGNQPWSGGASSQSGPSVQGWRRGRWGHGGHTPLRPDVCRESEWPFGAGPADQGAGRAATLELFLQLPPVSRRNKHSGGKKPFLKDRSGLHANLRQLLVLNNSIKGRLSLPAPHPLHHHHRKNCEKTKSWWAANKN